MSSFVEDVYDTLLGIREPKAQVEGVDNLFEMGRDCDKLYSQMLDAYERLCIRLGVIDEDADVEVIISSLLRIQREVSIRMYEYGAQFGIQ